MCIKIIILYPAYSPKIMTLTCPNSGPRVTMPHISFRDMGNQVELATVAVNERFDTIEPAIYSNGASHWNSMICSF